MVLAFADFPELIHVPVANEEDAIGVCAGASLVGRKPVVVIQNSGLVMATYALLDSIYWFGGFPILMIVDHRGAYGDDGGFIFSGYGIQVPRILESFQIPFRAVRDNENVAAEIRRGARTAQSSGKPAAILLTEETP